MKRVILASFVITIFGASVPLGRVPRSDNAQEIKALVAQLSWNSTDVVCGRFTILQIFPKGDAANQLIKIGKPATEELLAALGDESKAVAAHVILTALWEPRRVNHVTSESIYKKRLFGKKYVGTRYSFNELTWVMGLKGGSVDKANLAENAARWRAKVMGNQASAIRRRA